MILFQNETTVLRQSVLNKLNSSPNFYGIYPEARAAKYVKPDYSPWKACSCLNPDVSIMKAF